MMIDDDNIRFGRPLMHERDEAAFDHWAHFEPAQSSDRASNFDLAVLSSGSVRISARSPVSVVFSHSWMIWKSATSSSPLSTR